MWPTMSPRNPQLEPLWLKYQPSPRLSMLRPTAKGPTPTGVIISRALDCMSTAPRGPRNGALHFDDVAGEVNGCGPQPGCGLLGIGLLPLPGTPACRRSFQPCTQP